MEILSVIGIIILIIIALVAFSCIGWVFKGIGAILGLLFQGLGAFIYRPLGCIVSLVLLYLLIGAALAVM